MEKVVLMRGAIHSQLEDKNDMNAIGIRGRGRETSLFRFTAFPIDRTLVRHLGMRSKTKYTDIASSNGRSYIRQGTRR